MLTRTILATTLLLASGTAGTATSPADAARPGRFTMQAVDGGFIRLDTATGDVSLCSKSNGSFECNPVKDDRELQSELSRLSIENKELKAEIERLERLAGPNQEPAKPIPKLELPSEEDVDKALGYLERMFKKFRDKMRELDGNEDSSPKGTPL